MAIVKEESTSFGDYTLEDLLQMSLLASRRVNTDPIDSAVCDAFPDTTAAVKGFEELQFEPFSPVTKKTEAKINHTESGETFLVSKGAPEIMNALPGIDAATEERAAHLVDVQSAKGYKTLGVCKSVDGGETYSMVGYLSIMDEPRHDTKATIENAIALGVQVKMITGDQKKIAIEVARKLGMGENIMGPEIWLVNNRAVAAAGDIGSLSELASGFASVKPEHKHKVVTSLQEKGHVVGMTGDGVNDAPALAVANVGIAVADATDAARGAADIVLTEEGLSTIITAIRRSRMIFRRLESYIVYRLASSVFILGFFLISIISLKFDFPTWCLILLSIVNDFTVMATSSDNVRSSAYPLYWDVPQLVVKALLIGGICVLQAFLLLYFVQQGQQGEIQWLKNIGMHDMMDCEIVAVMYLNIAVCIQLNIFSARNKRFFFQTSEESDASPLPSMVLCVPVLGAVVLSTFLAVYWDADVALGGGNPMKGCGWGPAGAVWVWCIVWFLIIEVFKVALQGVYDRPNDGVEELFQGPIGRMVEEQMGFGPKEGEQDSLALMLTRQNRNSVTTSNRTAAALALAAAGEEMPVDRLPRLDKVSTLSMLKTIDALRVHVHALERRLMALDGHLVVEE
jgi:H+-transporting ATPase